MVHPTSFQQVIQSNAFYKTLILRIMFNKIISSKIVCMKAVFQFRNKFTLIHLFYINNSISLLLNDVNEILKFSLIYSIWEHLQITSA